MIGRKAKKYWKIVTSVVLALVMVLSLGFVAVKNGWGTSASSGHTLSDQHGRRIDGDEICRIAKEYYDICHSRGNPEYTWGGISAYYPAGQNDTIHGTGYHAGFDCSGFVTAVFMKYFGYTDNMGHRPEQGFNYYYKDPTGKPITAMEPLTYIGYVSGYGDIGTDGWEAMLKNWGISNSGPQALGSTAVLDNYQKGDIIYFDSPQGGIDHMGIYYGDGKVIHSTYIPDLGMDGMTICDVKDVKAYGGKTIQNYTIYEVDHRKPKETSLHIEKLDSGTQQSIAQGGATLAGATYELRDESGNLAHTFTIDANGKSDVAEHLPLGVYTLTETQSPTGYHKNNTPQKIDLTSEAGKIVTFNTPEEVVTGKLKIRKFISSENPEDNSPENCEKEAGAEFQVISTKYASNKEEALKVISEIASGARTVGPNEYAKMVTDKNGEAVSTPLAYGKYLMVQTKASEHAKIDPSLWEAVIPENAKEDTVIEYVIYNQPVTHYQFSKTDIAGQEIPGAKMQVLDVAREKVLYEWTSTDTPHVIKDIQPGKYVLREDLAPLGYVKANEVEFVVANKYAPQTVHMVDKVVTISKKDVGGEEVPGAKIQVIDEDGNIVDEWVSTEEEHRVSNLEVGKSYVIHEEVAPNGYTVATDIPFTVGEDDVNEHYDVVDKRVVVTKRMASDKSRTVEGAKLQIIDKDRNIVDEWYTKENEKHFAENLVVGETYTLHEEIAPSGFIRAEDVEFTVEDNRADQEVVMFDPDVFIHKTDDFNKRVVGAEMTVVDSKTGKAVDNWKTYGKIVDITDEQRAMLEKGSDVTLSSGVVIADETSQQIAGFRDKLLEIAQKMQSTTEEGENAQPYDYTTEYQAVRMEMEDLLTKYATENAPKDTEETKETEETKDSTETEETKDTEKTEETEKSEETKEEEEQEKVDPTAGYNTYLARLDKVYKDLAEADADKKGEVYNEKVVKTLVELDAQYLDAFRMVKNDISEAKIIVTENEKGELRYDLVTTSGTPEEPVVEYTRIDTNGYEYAHRIRGLEANGSYVIKEVKAPHGYAVAKDVPLVADPDIQTLTVRVVDSILLVDIMDTGIELSVQHVFIAGGVAIGLLVLWGGYEAVKKVRNKRCK